MNDNIFLNVEHRMSRRSPAAIRLSGLAVAFAALTAFSAPQKGQVAEGYMDWDGLTPKNLVMGRLITPSDLRQRAVVYVVLDAAKLTKDNVTDYHVLAALSPMPADHLTQWETQELPRDKIVAVSVRNLGKKTPMEFASEFKPPKDVDQGKRTQYTIWTQNKIPFYKDFCAVGEAELTEDKLPYVAVYGGSGTEPLYVKEKWTPADIKETRAAVSKAVKGLDEWTPPLGVAEPQFYKKVAADFAKGKPAQALLAQLKSGLKSKNPDQAKEAQIMTDAINQMKGDLMLRIQLEYHAAPARAYYDFNTLAKLFPAEKKNMQAFEAKFKANKEIGALGKVFEKIMLWSREDYVCKNAGEAKKNVQELQKFKKVLENLANSQNAQLQGEAMLFQSQIDTLIDIMPTKVPQK